MIETLSALLTPVLSIIATMILVNQYRLAKYRWRLDLYDKRFPAFTATMKYLSYVRQHGQVSQDVLLDFYLQSKDTELLFGDDIREYRELLYSKGQALYELEERLRPVPKGEERTALVKQQREIQDWFGQQRDVIIERFGAYLKIDKK